MSIVKDIGRLITHTMFDLLNNIRAQGDLDILALLKKPFFTCSLNVLSQSILWN